MARMNPAQASPMTRALFILTMGITLTHSVTDSYEGVLCWIGG